MKRDGQVRHQYRQVKYRTRKKLLDKSLRVDPCNCCFHVPASSDRGSRVVLCNFAEMTGDADWDTLLCDLPQAKRCNHFTPEATADEVKRRFGKFLAYAESSGDAQAIGALAFHYPDLAALLWVLEPWKAEEGQEGELVPCEVCGGQCDPQSPCEDCVAEGGCSCGASSVDAEDRGPRPIPGVSGDLVDSVEPSALLDEKLDEPVVKPDKVTEEAEGGEHAVVTSAEALRRFEEPLFSWLTPRSLVVTCAVVLPFLLLWLWMYL